MKIQEFTIGELMKKVSNKRKYTGTLYIFDDEYSYNIEVQISKGKRNGGNECKENNFLPTSK